MVFTRRMLVIVVAAAGLVGCGDPYARRSGGPFIRPTIAVMKFENRAPFPLKWNLGDGMRDILVDRLVASGRFQVIERPELAHVLDELAIQQSGATRQQGRSRVGRLKNVQYLIKGTITDFGHVSSSRGFLGASSWRIFGGGDYAVMGVTIYVVDVESGEILASRRIEKAVRAGDVNVTARYKDVAFGGGVFYRTPLGRATSQVIDQAVRSVTQTISQQPWQPRLALVGDDGSLAINGGWQHGLRWGQEFEVCQTGQAIVDPQTGDVLGQQSGPVIARIRVSSVHERHSDAQLLSGRIADLAVGQRCRVAAPAAAAPAQPPAGASAAATR